MSFILNPYKFASSGPVIEPDVVAWYRAENNADDASGNAHHGTPGSSAGYTTGHTGNAFLFAAGDNNTKINCPSINIGSTWSIEGWIYRTSNVGTARHVVSHLWSSASNFGAIYVNSNHSLTYVQNSTTQLTSATGAITLNTWHKFLITSDGSVLRMWLDGMLVARTVLASTFNNAFAIGQAVTNEAAAWGGAIDEVKICNSTRKGFVGLIAHYAGENNTNDSSGHGLTATPGAGTGYATGYSGDGFNFTGNTNQAVLTPVIILDNQYSVDFYMKPTNAGSGFMHTVSNAWSSSNYGALYYTSPNRLRYYQGGSERVASADNVITPGSWNRITVTYDGSKTRLYVNGTLVGTESGTHSEVFQNSTRIGYGTESNAFHGVIDEVKLYNNLIL